MSPGLELMISVYQCSSRQPVAAFAELWPKIRLETTEEIGRRAACATFGTGVALVALGVVLLDSECVAVEVVCPFFEPSVPVIDPSVLARAALERVLVTVDAM